MEERSASSSQPWFISRNRKRRLNTEPYNFITWWNNTSEQLEGYNRGGQMKHSLLQWILKKRKIIIIKKSVLFDLIGNKPAFNSSRISRIGTLDMWQPVLMSCHMIICRKQWLQTFVHKHVLVSLYSSFHIVWPKGICLHQPFTVFCASWLKLSYYTFLQSN